MPRLQCGFYVQRVVHMDQFNNPCSFIAMGSTGSRVLLWKAMPHRLQVNGANKYSVITPTTYNLLTVHALSVHKVCVLWKFMHVFAIVDIDFPHKTKYTVLFLFVPCKLVVTVSDLVAHH